MPSADKPPACSPRPPCSRRQSHAPELAAARCLSRSCRRCCHRRDASPRPGADEWPGAPGLPALQHAASHQDVRGGHHHGPSEASEEGTCRPRGPQPRVRSLLPPPGRLGTGPLAQMFSGPEFERAGSGPGTSPSPLGWLLCGPWFQRGPHLLFLCFKSIYHLLCHQVSSRHSRTPRVPLS